MSAASSAALVELLRRCHLLDLSQLEEVEQELAVRFPESGALAQELSQRGWLTAFQADEILRGHGLDLMLGSYVLLEKLGEGGMSQVFKARNWKLGRITALKLIRKERLANPDAIRRFEREARGPPMLWSMQAYWPVHGYASGRPQGSVAPMARLRKAVFSSSEKKAETSMAGKVMVAQVLSI